MADLSGVKVGDKLFVFSRFSRGRIEPILSISPTGRVTTETGVFDHRGYLRGANGYDRTMARPATEDDIAGVHRQGLILKIERFKAWDQLRIDELKAVSQIVERHSK